MERESVKYVLKNLDKQVPLYNPETREYMIVVDGAPLDIPEKLFKTLFVEYEAPKVEDDNNIVNSLFNSMSTYNVLKKQVALFKATGLSKEVLIEAVLKTMPKNDSQQQVFSKQIIDSLYEESN